jgi:site-specific recombinase XerD
MIIHNAAASFIDHCRYIKKLSPHTLRAYNRDLEEFCNFTGPQREIGEVDRTLLRNYLSFLFEKRRLKETSVKRRIACLKALFRWLEMDEVIAVSPFHRLDLRIRLPKRLPRNLSSDELRRLVAAPCSRLSIAAGQYGEDEVVRKVGMNPERIEQLCALVAIELLFATGVRVSEMTGITMADLDLPDGSLRVMGKGSRQRRVFIADPAVVSLLRGWLRIRAAIFPNSAQLLVTPRGYAANAAHIRKLIAAAGRDAGLSRPVTPHMLRHTTATLLLESGVDIRFVQRLLGHQSISTTEIYTAVSDESLRTAMLTMKEGKWR